MEKKQDLISLSVNRIIPSPYQHRRYFDEEKLKELALNIQRDGLVEPIVVRWVRGGYELIAGERRLRAVKDHTDMKRILAHVGSLLRSHFEKEVLEKLKPWPNKPPPTICQASQSVLKSRKLTRKTFL